MKISFLFLSVIISLQAAANEDVVKNHLLKTTSPSVDIGENGYTPMPGPDGHYVGIVLFEFFDKKVQGTGKMILHLKTDPTQPHTSKGEAIITPEHNLGSIVKALDKMRDEQGCSSSFQKRDEQNWLTVTCPHDVGAYGQR